ncbi:WS/DGAT domain-containing protein [Nocardia cyriacigeorgica]|uniref:DUF1298 domain-containing protein n=1 Tax=Nocardia cyriacigeorgica TaxID=135487 RepID=A0A5R8NS54_9NOCA|nr:WS/DGAT domain-containing protein [Nocardia cyriacigeorgica]TLF78398.1 DUF1298 domain-containing protein [Nocardia cyriacigeorgica]
MRMVGRPGAMVRPQDATMYWLSRRTRNDLFLLYCFAESELGTDQLCATIARRSATIPDLCVRLRPAPRDLAYPTWVPCPFNPEQFVEHRLPQTDWAHLEQALGEVLATGVDAAIHPWRIHVFRGITGAPLPSPGEDALHEVESAAPQRVTVAVLQMSHALADGKRAADLARALFAPDPEAVETSPQAPAARPHHRHASDSGLPVSAGGDVAHADRPGDDIGLPSGALGSSHPPRLTRHLETNGYERFRTVVEAVRFGSAAAAIPVRMARTMAGGVSAFRAQRALGELTEAGELPEAGGGFAPSVVNGPGEVGGHRVRMIVCPAAQLRPPGFSVTVVALTAVSIALERYLERRGALPDRLGAQVPMALPAPGLSDRRDENLVRRAANTIGGFVRGAPVPRNNYRSLGVDLCADEPDPRRRAERIAADLAARRTRAIHPLLSVQDRVTASLPAPILRRDVDRYPIDTVPDALAGHTVVSSVYRGPADLTFGGAPVLFTAGFPALGAVMHLTHGVHGLGDTVTISVHADPETMPDLDFYADLLRAAVDEVGARVRDAGSGPVD